MKTEDYTQSQNWPEISLEDATVVDITADDVMNEAEERTACSKPEDQRWFSFCLFFITFLALTEEAVAELSNTIAELETRLESYNNSLGPSLSHIEGPITSFEDMDDETKRKNAS